MNRTNLTLKWLGTLSYLAGMACTALVLYPFNLYLSLAGAVLWMVVAWRTIDKPLMLLEGIGILIFIGGLYKHYM